MRFAALACDYDGTLASDDGIAPEALAALERARQARLRLILVLDVFADRTLGHQIRKLQARWSRGEIRDL